MRIGVGSTQLGLTGWSDLTQVNVESMEMDPSKVWFFWMGQSRFNLLVIWFDTRQVHISSNVSNGNVFRLDVFLGRPDPKYFQQIQLFISQLQLKNPNCFYDMLMQHLYQCRLEVETLTNFDRLFQLHRQVHFQESIYRFSQSFDTPNSTLIFSI